VGVTGRRSPHSLYDHGLATYDAGDSFRHADSEGFVRLWGLGIETWASIQGPMGEAPGGETRR
jgi:argininosuccinate synthase